MSLLIAEAKRRVLVGSTMRLLSRYLASVSRYPSLLPAMIGSPAAIASTKIIPKLSPWVVGARKISECLRKAIFLRPPKAPKKLTEKLR